MRGFDASEMRSIHFSHVGAHDDTNFGDVDEAALNNAAAL